MPWGRLDDKGNTNDKLLALSDPAWRMWGCGLIYCQANLTDGFIPEHAIHAFGVRYRNKTALAEELCRSLVPHKGPLWHRVDGGYNVHDYLHWNDSREMVVNQRLTSQQRKALLENPGLRKQIRDRDGDNCRYCGCVVRWNDRKGSHGGTYDHVKPYGGNSLDNLVVACRGCNSSKRGRTPDGAGMPLLPPRSTSRSGSGLFGPIQGLDQGQDQAFHSHDQINTSVEEHGSASQAEPPKVHPLKELIAHYSDEYLRIVGVRPHINGKKDAGILTALLSQHELSIVLAALNAFLSDDYSKRAGFPLTLFSSQFNRYLAASVPALPKGDWYGHIPHCRNKDECLQKYLGKAVAV